MAELQQLITETAQTRQQLINRLRRFTHEQGKFQPGADDWSIVQHVEHMVMAEQGCIRSVWAAAEALRRGQRRWSVDPQYRNQSIEAIVAHTWQPGQAAPDYLVPQGKGPLSYWIVALQANQTLVEALPSVLEGLDPSEIVAPHPISGPWHAFQWLAFLRYHLEMHGDQIEQVTQAAGFP